MSTVLVYVLCLPNQFLLTYDWYRGKISNHPLVDSLDTSYTEEMRHLHQLYDLHSSDMLDRTDSNYSDQGSLTNDENSAIGENRDGDSIQPLNSNGEPPNLNRGGENAKNSTKIQASTTTMKSL